MPDAPKRHQGPCPYLRRKRPKKDKAYRRKRWLRLAAEKKKANPLCEFPGCTKLTVDIDHSVRVVDEHDDNFYNYDVLVSYCKAHHAYLTVMRDGGLGKPKLPPGTKVT